MSFWKTMPVVVENFNEKSFTQVVSNETFLNKINYELTNAHPDLKSEIIYNITPKLLEKIKKFFDENYSENVFHRIHLYEFFAKRSFIVKISIKETVVGYIFLKKKKYHIHGYGIYNFMDASFLCFSKLIRNAGIIPFIINHAIKESIELHNIPVFSYSVSAQLKIPCYTSKQIIHRPIKIKKLIKDGFLSGNLSDYNQFKVYNKGTQNYYIKYFNNELPENNILTELVEKVNNYNTTNFKICDIIDNIELTELFLNKGFHHFIIYDNEHNQNIISYINFYVLDCKITSIYSSSTIYNMYFKNNDIQNIHIIIETICEYCKINNIIDVFSFYDVFNCNYINDMKCLYGAGVTKYYMLNFNIPFIQPFENSIVHI
jgi:hypothetical protein